MFALSCGLSNWGDCLKLFLEIAVKAAIGGLLAPILDALQWVIAQSLKLILESVGTMWLKVDTLPLDQSGGSVDFVRDQTVWLVAFAGGLSLIIAGTRLAWHQRGEPFRDLIKGLLVLVVVSTSAVATVSLLTQLSDQVAEVIINASLGANGETFASRIAELITGPMTNSSTGLSIVLLFGTLALVTSLVQIGLMIVRNVMLVLLAGVLPLAAAATNTEIGKAWLRKVCGWLVAFIVYKPVAALIYATALGLAGNPSGDILKIITGVTMMLLAVVAMPALLRLVAPKGA